MKTSLAVFVFSLVSITPALVMGTTIAQWTFDDGAQTPTPGAPNTTVSSFTINSGGITFPQGNPSTGLAISGTGWNVADGNAYWEFTVTPNSGYTLDLASLMFDDRASGTGPSGWSVTINGVTAASRSTHGSFVSGPMNTIDLSAVAFQDLTAADVKIFGFGASGSMGTWRLDNVNLDGMVTQVASVPDSISFGFAAAVLFGVLIFPRRIAVGAQG